MDGVIKWKLTDEVNRTITLGCMEGYSGERKGPQEILQSHNVCFGYNCDRCPFWHYSGTRKREKLANFMSHQRNSFSHFAIDELYQQEKMKML